jgi:ferredoxin
MCAPEAAVLQAGVDKAQQCQLLSACLDCWTEVKEEIDEAALHKLEDFIENHASLRCSCAFTPN